MKKFILSVFTGLACLGAANAQSFTVDADTVKYTVHTGANIYNNIKNISGSDLVLKWKVIYHNFPQNWEDATGICDNITCYSNGVLDGTQYTADTVVPSATLDFHLQMNLIDGDPGTHYVTIEVNDDNGTVKNITFEISKYPNSIKGANKDDNRLLLYPNPAQGEINVNLTAVQGVKNLAIYNIIGKVVSTHRVIGNNTRIDISALPEGVYIMRLMDAKGGIITTRKFMHN